MVRKIALVGIGKIALDQHVPALAASPDWDLAATVSRSGTVPGVESFTDIGDMLAARPDIEVVSLCLPLEAHPLGKDDCHLGEREEAVQQY